MEVLFGPWPRLAEFVLPSVHIAPLPEARETLRELRSSKRFSKGWYYPPLDQPIDDQREDAPLVPVLAYGLPPTHALRLGPPLENDDYADFLIAAAGLMDGVRLTREGWSHFYKAPLEPAKLCDFYPDRAEILEFLRIASAFWWAHSPEIRSRLFGAVHWLQFGSLLQHEFERFSGAYTVLDTLYWLHENLGGPTSKTHAARASDLASHYELALPPWAAIRPDKKSRLSDLRNELIHEARFAGAPTGFDHPDDYPEIAMELTHFVYRLLFAIMQVPARYVRTPSTTRHMHGFDMMGPLQAV